MNQLKQLFGWPMTLSHTVRGSSLTRSAGSSGRGPRRSGEILVSTCNREDSPEPRICDKSYARLIADYSKVIEGRNTGTGCNDYPAGREINAGFFSTKSFERLAKVPSMVRFKNSGTNTGSSLSTNSSSGPPVVSSVAKGNLAEIHASLDETEVLDQVNTRADWLDHVVRAHRARRASENNAHPNDCEEGTNRSADSLFRSPVDSFANESVKDSSNLDCRTASAKKIAENLKVDGKNVPHITKFPKRSNDTENEFFKTNNRDNRMGAKNVSVTVKPLEKNDRANKELSTTDFGDNATFIVTVTEESKSSSTSETSPLRHIDLRINGEPATGMDTVIRKIEKLDVVSLAEKIEIKIPVLSEVTGKIGEDPRVSTSTINLCISSRVKGSRDSVDDGHVQKFSNAGDTATSRPGSAHPSTFYISKFQNVRKTERSKVVPWWTTEESFRHSEAASVRSSESAITTNEAKKTYGLAKAAAPSNNCRAHERGAKENAISDAKIGMKPVVPMPSGSRQRSRTSSKPTTNVSKITESVFRRKSEQTRDNPQQHRLLNGVTKPTVRHDGKVKSSASYQLIKSDQATSQTFHEGSKKMPTTISSRENLKAPGAVPGAEAATKMEYDKGTNGNLSSTNSSKESIRFKPITAVAKNNSDNNNGGEGGATNTGQIGKAEGSTGSKTGPKPQPGVASKSEIKATSQLPRTHGSVRLLPTTQSVPDPVNRPERNSPIKQSDETSSSGRLTDAKNPILLIKPIEKKKDGTLIDYGLTVSTRKKPERKLPDSQSTTGLDGKKIPKKEEPAVTATIKEVIPMRNKESRGGSINRGIVEPARLIQNGSAGNRTRTTDKKYDPCQARKTLSRERIATSNDAKKSKTAMKTENNSIDSIESKNPEATSAEKKLLYSAWLRRSKEKNGQDPDSTKNPRKP